MNTIFRVDPNVAGGTSHTRLVFSSHNTDAVQNQQAPTGSNQSDASRKRSLVNDENDIDKENDTRPKKRRTYTKRRTTQEKLDAIFDELDKAHWTLGEFLWQLFRKQPNNKKYKRHTTRTQKFLDGDCNRTLGEILQELFTRSYTDLSRNSPLHESMYSTTVPYPTIAHAGTALTAFAAQIIEERLVDEAVNAVKPANGLHATLRKRGHQRVEWADIGQSTVEQVSNSIQKHQPLTWHYFNSIVESKTRRKADSGRRPVHMVCTHAIAALDFARNHEARLLPLARGLHHFSLCSPADLMSYASHVGEIPSYQTIRNTLGHLSNQEAAILRKLGRNPAKFGFLETDNVQNYQRLQDIRIGRTNQLNIGMAATWVELEEVDSTALDLGDKHRRINENLRSKLTVEQLRNGMDIRHLDTVGSLHWLLTLVNYIPELSQWKGYVSDLFRTRVVMDGLRLPAVFSRAEPIVEPSRARASIYRNWLGAAWRAGLAGFYS